MNGIAITCDLCGGILNPVQRALGMTQDSKGRWQPDWSRVAQKHFCHGCAEDLARIADTYWQDLIGESASWVE